MCDDLFPTRIISEAQICAGGEQGKDACRGDSGGPLMTLNYGMPSFWMLNGLVSYGPNCLEKTDTPRPSVYVNVEKYMDWIESEIKK
jgi:secreted trypsin-like serine protease